MYVFVIIVVLTFLTLVMWKVRSSIKTYDEITEIIDASLPIIYLDTSRYEYYYMNKDNEKVTITEEEFKLIRFRREVNIRFMRQCRALRWGEND